MVFFAACSNIRVTVFFVLETVLKYVVSDNQYTIGTMHIRRFQSLPLRMMVPKAVPKDDGSRAYLRAIVPEHTAEDDGSRTAIEDNGSRSPTSGQRFQSTPDSNGSRSRTLSQRFQKVRIRPKL